MSQLQNPWVGMGQTFGTTDYFPVPGYGLTGPGGMGPPAPAPQPGAKALPFGPAPQFIPPPPEETDYGAQFKKFYEAPRLAALEARQAEAAALPPEAGTPEAAQAAIVDQATAAGAAPAGGPLAAPTGAPRGTQVTEGVKKTAKSSGPGTNLRDLIGQLNERELASLKQQGLTTEKLRKALGALETKELPMNLMGLAALTDAWTGSNFAQHYQPEETARDRQAAIEKLRGQITSAEQGLSEQEVGLLRSKLNSQFQLENMEATERQRQEQNAIEWAKLNAEKQKVAQVNPMDAFQAQVTLDKLDTTKTARGSIELVDALNRYESVVNKYGGRLAGVPKAELSAAYEPIVIAFKNAGELGALSGPDMGIVKGAIGKAGGVDGYFNSLLSGGDAGVREQIRAMRNAAAHKFDQRYQGLQEVAAPIYPLVQGYVQGYRTRMDEALKVSKLGEMSRDELLKQARAKAQGGKT